MELSNPVTTGTVVRPEPRVLEKQLCHMDNLPKDSHSTPNTDASSPTDQSSPLTLPHVEPAWSLEQQNTSELEAQGGLNDCMANTVRTCNTECDARTANHDNTDNTTRPTNADREVSVNNDVSTRTAVLVCSEYHASTVSVSYTADKVRTAQSETLVTSVDKISAFSETAQLTEAEKGVLVERNSGIKASTEGFAEEEEKVVQEDKATVAPQTNQEAKSVGVTKPEKLVTQSEEQPSCSQSSSKAAESQEKKKGRL